MPRARNWGKKRTNVTYTWKYLTVVQDLQRIKEKQPIAFSKAVQEDKIHFLELQRKRTGKGLGVLGGKTVKLQRVEKPYLLKQTLWNGIFPPPQIKMLKHNKCTVHLTSSMLCMQPNHLLAQNRLLSSNWFLGVALQQKRGCAFERVCVCLPQSTGTKTL